MKAMVLEKANQPLVLKTVSIPLPNQQQVLVKIIACGVCRTDLHIVDGHQVTRLKEAMNLSCNKRKMKNLQLYCYITNTAAP